VLIAEISVDRLTDDEIDRLKLAIVDVARTHDKGPLSLGTRVERAGS
jgi:hypothetical protein